MNKAGKERVKKERRILPGVIIIAFIAAAITFFLLLNIEKNMLQDYEKASVWVAAGNLQESLEINVQNVEKCFVRIEMDKSQIPEYAIEDIQNLVGSQTALMLPKGTVITAPMFRTIDTYIDNMTDPVIIGCKADDLYQVASGILRKGDFVNVYTVNDELEETYLLWEDVLIYQTFDSAGNQIAGEDMTTAAARINLLMEERYAEQFYTELHNGSLRMVKIWN